MALDITGYTKTYTLTTRSDMNDQLTENKSVNLGDFYAKVERVDASKSTANAVVSFMQLGNVMFQENRGFTPSVADGAENFIKQAYEHLKTLPEFANAVDA